MTLWFRPYNKITRKFCIMTTRLFVFSLFAVTALSFAFAATPAAPVNGPTGRESIFDRMYNQPVDVVEITLEMNMPELMANKRTENFMPAAFTYQGQSWDIEARVRGRFRRRACDFPPLRLKFPKQMLTAGGLSSHNSFKLVTHCNATPESAEAILREQLTYELYGMITEQSFRTQLVKVTYKDSATGATDTHYGILIEDTDEMADRLGAEECEDCYNQPVDQFQAGTLERMSLFQYMVGNNDWSIVGVRNMKLVRLTANGQLVAVPYDFDFAGTVMAPYAKPNSNIGQQFVGQRIRQTEVTLDPAHMKAARDVFFAKKDALIQHVEQYRLLPRSTRREIVEYLNTFYLELEQGVTLVAQVRP
jgi:hypothetical protein